MIRIHNYLTTKINKSKIKANNKTIQQIIKEEMDKYGHDCDLNYVDVSEVTDMHSLFCCHKTQLSEKYKDLNPDISEWDVSKVTDMEYMFYECESFNCNLSNWNVSNALYMEAMFFGCKKFNQNLSSWDVSNVKNHRFMFDDCLIQEKHKPHFIK